MKSVYRVVHEVRRYSKSKGEYIDVADMHPGHVLNALIADLTTDKRPKIEELLANPLFRAYIENLYDAMQDVEVEES